jgi:uncharacterized RDD family membrane protein YckC
MVIITKSQKNLARRFYANALDYIIVFVVTGLYILIFGEPDGEGTYRVNGIMALPIPLVWLMYFPVCEGTMGQTLGKRAFHLHVVDLEGRQVSVFQAFLRRMLDFLELATFGVAGLLTINFSEKNQRIGDMLGGTTVIKTDSRCRQCGADLELSLEEAFRDTFYLSEVRTYE